ncbi:hypothetical protein, partial [uncultured Robinsoniella sp.]|uniref:hypothetical protein n=1 Tax=uncultured Robinsoniella sp. TaxID=904190 RepID=UPI00374E235E
PHFCGFQGFLFRSTVKRPHIKSLHPCFAETLIFLEIPTMQCYDKEYKNFNTLKDYKSCKNGEKNRIVLLIFI